MLDLVSTRAGTTHETRAYMLLLAAVIAQAIRDACQPVDKREISVGKNLHLHARMAMHFLFGRNPAFDAYASLIGGSAGAMRAALLDPAVADHVTLQRSRAELNLRALRVRETLYRMERKTGAPRVEDLIRPPGYREDEPDED